MRLTSTAYAITAMPVLLTGAVLVLLMAQFEQAEFQRRQAGAAREALDNTLVIVQRLDRAATEMRLSEFESVKQQIPSALNDLEKICHTENSKVAASKIADQLGNLIGLSERIRWFAPLAPQSLCPIELSEMRSDLRAGVMKLISYSGALSLQLDSELGLKKSKTQLVQQQQLLVSLGFLISLLGTGAMIFLLRRSTDAEIAELDRKVHDAEALLNEARKRESDSFNTSSNVICSIDTNDCFAEANDAVDRWGYSAQNLIGLPVEGVFSNTSSDVLRGALATARKEGKAQFEAAVVTADGKTINTVVAAQNSAHGERIFCIIQDATQRKHLEKMIEQCIARENLILDHIPAAVFLLDEKGVVSRVNNAGRQLIKRLGATALVDMDSLGSNPDLQISKDERVVFILDISERNELEQEKQQILAKLAETASKAKSDRITQLFQGIIKKERESLSQTSVTPIENDLCTVVQRAVDAMQEPCEAAQVKVQYSPPAPILWRVDAPRMVQVLCNLFENALQFSIKGDRMDVRLRQTSFDEVVIEVSDQGPSIDEAAMATVFDPFVQARRSDKPCRNGLGLAIAQAIVRAHGGAILVSNNANAGCTFTIILKNR